MIIRVTLLMALAFLTACGGAPKAFEATDSAPQRKTESKRAELERARKDSGGKKSLAREKDDDVVSEKIDSPDSMPDPIAPAPGPGIDSVEITGGGDLGGFEGDTFEEDAREAIDDLVGDIEKDIVSYREEFGVEGLTANSPDSCEEICDVSEAICKSSKRICAISGNHPQESYFADRCQWSSKQCTRAGEQCVTCSSSR